METADRGDFFLVSPHGDVGYEHEEELRAGIELGLSQPGKEIVVDLSDVRYVDSAGLNVLLSARRRLERPISLVGLKPTLRRLFNLAGLMDCRAFRFFETLAEAAAALEAEKRNPAGAPPRTSQLPCLPPAPTRCLLPNCSGAAPRASDGLTKETPEKPAPPRT